MGAIEVVLGDITTEDVEIIVTAANESLMGGGGVDGAIHRAAGPRLAAAGAKAGPCEPGKAIATPAFDLAPVKYVIHTVGPVWEGGEHGEDLVLTSCYLESLLLAEELEVASIAFPAIATGVYGFPTGRAAEIATMAVRSLPIIDLIRFVAFDDETYAALTAGVAKPIVEHCPTCGAGAIPFVIGLPVPAVRAAAEAGLVRLGGCLRRGEDVDPQWACTKDSAHCWTNGKKDDRRHHTAVLAAAAQMD
ncbi:macro domain-containing protein [Actinocrispum wychmicini]|uniref:O-acetyl-ADP-ribose deacetylase (Regulator of RNase III) n=1 Tax=Actinocrispum wychmicini TaxID=1213861 RepID=A0A4R2J5X1_9PSEU|nr:macro domain-containing protein [Actinocrispum wychmicini]TCO54333.1 O-acetyl-ADP-ribose deacetylase (regulator of RNase III) [Actinocrispum wychmicini]